jgi:uncharacterized NAD(P)/FAD-binding protein YdhS
LAANGGNKSIEIDVSNFMLHKVAIPMIKNRIGIIGTGPAAIYTLKHILDSDKLLEITMFESSSELGKGMPYRGDMNADYMLCNAFSKEIPTITTTLISWLEKLPKRELGEWELSSHELSARAFYPRVLIGEYLEDEFHSLCKRAEAAGHHLNMKSNEHVHDVIPLVDGTTTILTNKPNAMYEFDQVIIASGHSWPVKPKLGDASLLSPWPYTNVTQLVPGNIGILGSSLSAIDIVVALGNAHGQFIEQGEKVSWVPHNNVTNLKITMVSKEGIMPEADFYYPYPYEKLQLLSPKAVDAEVEKGSDGLLKRLFGLLIQELKQSDPDYLQSLGDDASTVEGFLQAYFKKRQELGGLAATRDDFSRARKSFRERKIIGYRYVLLRAHENFDRALRAFDETDWTLFKETLLPVFADSYAAVPHLSLARVIAMFDAKVLALEASGSDAKFSDSPNGGVEVRTAEETMKFDVMIDARGQASAPLDDLPFPSLARQLANSQEPLTAPFKLQTPSSIYCLALPQLLQRYPFSQGLENAAENGKTVAESVLRNV